MTKQHIYPRIEGPKRLPDGTYQVVVFRSATDSERLLADTLEHAQQTIAFLQRAKTLFMPSEDQVQARTRGRKPKLTPQIHQAIVQRIKNGCPNKVAAQASGIDEKTFYNWVNRGKEATDENDIFFQFFQDVEVARAEDEYSLVHTIRRSAEHDWRAAEALLKRGPQYKARWSDRGLLDGGESIRVIFNRPALDPDVKGDDLMPVMDIHDEEDKGNGSGNGDAGDR